MSKRSTHHATFVIGRDYAAPPARVFGAWAEPEAKTLEFKPASGGTRLVLTEQDVFLDGIDNAASREKGARDLLDNLDKELQRHG
jgi:uncharacterized protein YndB with AHSA1/START domain